MSNDRENTTMMHYFIIKKNILIPMSIYMHMQSYVI